MSINKKTWQFGLAGALILMMGASVFADLELKPYGAAQYRFRERVHSQTGEVTQNNVKDTVTGTTVDYHNLFSWRTGVRAKVDDKLSLQLQIGNDWSAGEGITWANNNTVGARVGYNNLYVHLASFKWNPGPAFVEGGVIPLSSNGSLDLLERSINLGHYGEANFQGWSTELINSLLGIRVGVPILKGDLKLGVELVQSIIDQRNQTLSAKEEIPSHPTAPLFVLTAPVEAGALKVAPELAIVVNRNFNTATELGDHEILAGLAGSYKVSKDINVSLSGGYGSVSNENSKVGTRTARSYSATAAADADYGACDSIITYRDLYGTNTRVVNISEFDAALIPTYISNGLLLGVGTSVKVGPGTIQFDFKYNSAVNSANSVPEVVLKTTYKNAAGKDSSVVQQVVRERQVKNVEVTNPADGTKTTVQENVERGETIGADNTKYGYFYTDIRYAYKAHDKLTITPRYRNYYRTFPVNNSSLSRMENRFELILEGSF